jgi:basic membrane lipoprotein Med (substrate-binding protein (PBP1-ABC) superfamily)
MRPILKSVRTTSEEYGFEAVFVDTPPDADLGDFARRHIDEGFNVIVAVLWWDPEPLMVLAHERPETTFVGFGFPALDTPPNVALFGFRMGEGGFLVGALAARATESGVVGIVAGPRGPAVEQLIGGYERGLNRECPDCRLVVRDVDSFTDRQAGLDAGRDLVAEGADVVFNAAGETGSAAIRAAAQDGAWVIGVDTDEFASTFEEGRAPNAQRLLGSIVWRVDKHVHKVLASIAEDRFEPGHHALGIAEEGVEFIPSPEAAHPRQDELGRHLKELVAAVREGRTRP